MEAVSIIDTPTRAQWDAVMMKATLPHIYQSWEYGDLYATLRPEIRPLRLLAFHGKVPIAALQSFEWRQGRIHRGIISGGSGSGGGPAIARDTSPSLKSAAYAGLLQRTEEIFRECKSLRLLLYTQMNDDQPMPNFHAPVRRTLKYNPVIELPPMPEELLTHFHRNARRHLKESERNGVEVAEGNRADLRAFWLLQQELARRKGLDPRLQNSLEDLERVWDIMNAPGLIKLFVARHQGNIVTISIILNFAKSMFHRGDVCNEAGYETCANYAIHWHLMKQAIESGFTFFNMMGGTSDAQSDRFGVTRFKLSFGARLAPFYRYSAAGNPLRRWRAAAVDRISRRTDWVSAIALSISKRTLCEEEMFLDLHDAESLLLQECPQ
jgi:hypothetical protein